MNKLRKKIRQNFVEIISNSFRFLVKRNCLPSFIVSQFINCFSGAGSIIFVGFTNCLRKKQDRFGNHLNKLAERLVCAVTELSVHY